MTTNYKEYATKLPNSSTWWERDGDYDDHLDVLEIYCSGDMSVSFAWACPGKTGWFDAAQDPLTIEVAHISTDHTPVWAISVSDMVSDMIDCYGGSFDDEGDVKRRALAMAEALEAQAKRLREACV